jgi:hypothetical protein
MFLSIIALFQKRKALERVKRRGPSMKGDRDQESPFLRPRLFRGVPEEPDEVLPSVAAFSFFFAFLSFPIATPFWTARLRIDIFTSMGIVAGEPLDMH